MKTIPLSLLAAILCSVAWFNWAQSWDSRIRAQYAAEARPVIGDLRVQVELFRYENPQLPGLARDMDGQFVPRKYEPIAEMPWYYHDTRMHDLLCAGAFAQSIDGTNLTYQVSESGWKPVDEREYEYHFVNELGVNIDDMMGRRIRPCQIQYLALAKASRASYLYVIGVFGNGDGLPEGTGCAVMEYSCVDLGVRNVMTWERYFSIGNEQSALWLQSMKKNYDPQDENSHIVPVAVELFTAQTQGELAAAKSAMKSWGWNTDIRRPGHVKRNLIQISLASIGILALVVSSMRYGLVLTLLNFMLFIIIIISLIPIY